MHLLRFIALPIALMLGAITAHAGTKVIDVELGVSTLDQVRKIASAAGRVQYNGTNTWTGGPSLVVQSGDYGIEGLQAVEYIFDSSKKLTAVIMVLGKHRFGDIVDVLAGTAMAIIAICLLRIIKERDRRKFSETAAISAIASQS